MLNKVDLLDQHTRRSRVAQVREALAWAGPCFEISALARQGTRDLCEAIMAQLETMARDAADDAGAEPEEVARASFDEDS